MQKTVFFGELLMRLATKRYECFVHAHNFEIGYTGAETNAAVSLANFGLEAYVVSAAPDTKIGQACINYIRQFGTNTEFVIRAGGRRGTFNLETGDPIERRWLWQDTALTEWVGEKTTDQSSLKN